MKKSKTHEEHHKASHLHKKPAHPVHRARKKPLLTRKTVTGIVVFVVLVAVVYALIMLVSKAGETRSMTAATVNGEAITVAYLDEQYSRIPAVYQQFITKETLLNQTINEVILLQEAEKEGITVSDEDVRAEIEAAMEMGGITAEELEVRLAEQNMTIEALEELYKKQLIINALLEEKLFSNIDVSDAAVQEYYDSRIRAMHILVETEDGAYDIITQLGRVSRNNLETKFGELAAELSIDPSAATNNGDLGEFGKGQMVLPFEEAAFALEEYEYSAAPVETSFGYHVILRLPKESSLEYSMDEIRSTLMMQKQAEVVPNYLNQLRAKADIQVFYTGE